MPSTRPTVDPVLDILEEMGYDFDELDGDGYKRSLKEAIIKLTIKDPKDPRIGILTLEFQKVKGSRKVEPKEKRTVIRGDKLMGREPKKDAPSPTAGKPKLLTGVGKFNTDDVKPADVDKKQKDSSDLKPDKLDSIAKTVESIALLLRRQFNLEKKQQRDSRRQQSKADRDAREDKLETKPDGKTGLIPKAIKKPALNFFEKLKRFFLNIVIGAGVMKLFEWLKDPANAEKITKFKDFLINNAGWILGGLAAIALLPIAIGLVSVVQGILAGLALLGPLLPLLPKILAALLIGAVAWWIGKKIHKSIVGGEGFSKARDDNLKRLEAHGIKKSGLALDPDTGEEIYVKRWEGSTGASGDDKYGSLEGRPWGPGDKGRNDSVKINLREAEHQKWYSDYYGSEKLKEKLDALNLYDKTKDAIIEKKNEMDSEVNKNIKSFNESKTDKAYESSGLPETVGGRIRMFMNDPGEYRKRHKQYVKDFEENRKQNLVDNEEIRKDYNKEVLGIIDKNVKPDTNVPVPSTKGKGGVSVIDGGTGATDGGSSSGGGGESSEEDEMFSSEDPNDPSVFSSKSLYNLGAA